MTIEEIYQLAIKLAIKADPRGEEGVKKYLSRAKKEYEELPSKKKEEFDLENLKNPYSDSRILYGDPSTPIDSILAGIDIGVGEVLLADRLKEKGEGIDLILGHHPHGAALAALHEVMELQIDVAEQYGVPVNVAESLLRDRMGEVSRRFSPVNHFQSVDAARILGLPFLVTHTVTDNLVYDFMKKTIEEKKPETVGEVVEMLKEIPEYKEAVKFKAGPIILVGNEKSRAGRVVPTEFTGGTEGSKELYEKLSSAGVGTILGMHLSEEHRKEAEKHHINVVIGGHIVSDSVGMNLFLDELQRKGIKVIPCSGLIRVSRVKN
ncbi:MAG: NGG1p interacting factor NIF3 [Candidatus Woykebacteria bacterium RBG_13_40_7b]|uniref:NGG1p interacting factor NIF3 n=1 Tax=Candidatus Woykebacteria bacterium RBG_13_40_7b TaxID=1802594 RepID=A0A1G1W814_9BACT|nr:MAG: NGG1p interacting factor NIF3 [Candidatus Woykebacteria bacterium RBG_13_40_7b]